MTSVPDIRKSMPHKGAQITYREEKEFPVESAFHPAHISSPLGEYKGGKHNYVSPKRIPASRRLTLKDDRLYKNAKNKITNSDRINSYAIKSGYDYVNRRFHYENLATSQSDLYSHLFTLLCDRLQPTDGERGIKGIMTYGMVERYAHRAAEYVLQAWTPDYFTKQALKGAKGGRKSKRKPEYTYADFLKVDGLSHAEAAAVLEVSPSTVRRMRDTFSKPERVPGDFLPPTLKPTTAGPSVDELLNTP